MTVRVLGATEITVGSRRIGMSTEALFALALYLTTRAGDRVPRDEVLETFWPGTDEEPRRHALRQMLYRLRQKGFAFDEDGDCLRLDPAKVDSDLRSCLAPTWPESATAAAVDAALSVGPTFSARLPAPFLAWFDGVRSEVSHQARKAAMQLIATCRSQGRWADLDRWGKAVLATDPLHEEATLARAEAAAMTGAKTLALEILDGYLAEIGTVDATVGKPAQVLRKRIAERRASWIPTGPREVALIGREEEMSVLTQAVESALAGKSRSVLLVGPSGYGKSRLLAEAREYAALRGVRCVAVRAEATLASHPWSLVREVFRCLVSVPGAAAVDPRAMSTIRALLREDAATESGIGFTPITTADEIRMALTALIEAIGHETRSFITVDDIQSADERSLTVLYDVLADIQDGRCSCAAATHPAAQLRSFTIPGRHGIQVLRLRPLTLNASRALAGATARAQNTDLSEDALDRIAENSGGHPLFARELAASFTRSGGASTLPATLADVVSRHLSSQASATTRILRTVALLADAATIARVQRVSGLERVQFLEAVDALAQEGVLQLDQSRALRLHASWHDRIIASSPDAVLATLALECASALHADLDTRSLAAHSRLAELYRIGGEPHLALQFRLEGIDALLAAGLYESALDEILKEPHDSYGDTSVARLRVRESVALLALGRPAEGQQKADEVWRSRALQTSQHISEHILAVGVSADCHIKLDIADRAPVAELKALAGKQSLSAQDIARCCLWGVRLVSNSTHHGSMPSFIESLRCVSAAAASPTGALVELIFAAEAGSADDIAAAYDRIRAIEQQDLSIHDRCLLLRCAAHALRIGGQVDEALATGEAAYKHAEINGARFAARLAAELLCNTLLDYEQHAAADDWLSVLSEISSGGGHGNTQTSLDHVRDRLALATGAIEGAAERSRKRVDLVRTFGSTHGKYGELALAAALQAACGDMGAAEGLVADALEGAKAFAGRPVADFIVDTCLRASNETGLRAAVEVVGRNHLALRAGRGDLPLAPAFRELRALSKSLARA